MVSPKLAVVSALPLLACSAFGASSYVGTWKGKLELNEFAVARVNPQMQSSIRQKFAATKGLKITLTLGKDMSYTLKATLPNAATQPPANSGKWSAKGNQITLSSGTKNAPPQVLTASKNGKTLTLETPTGFASVSFTK